MAQRLRAPAAPENMNSDASTHATRLTSTPAPGGHTHAFIIIILKKFKGGRVYLGSQSEVQSTKADKVAGARSSWSRGSSVRDKDEPGSSA